MIIKMTIEHTIEPGQERRAMALVKELNLRNPRHAMGAPATPVESDEAISPWDSRTGYLEHLEDFSRLAPLSCAPAKVRVYLTPCA